MNKDLQVFGTQDIKEMARHMGPLFGKKPEDMFALMLISQAEGLHPATAAQEYDIIQGKPAINSRAAQSRFQKSGGKIEFIEYTDTKCTAKFSHSTGTEITVTWTIEDAKRIGLAGKNTWKQYPRQMLKARVIAEGVRACYPACLSGMYTTDEVQDFSPDRSTENVRTETPKAPAFRNVSPDETHEEVTFPDDEPQVTFDIRNFRESHKGTNGAEIKLFILDYILEKDDSVHDSAHKIITNIINGGKLEQLCGFIDLYLLHEKVAKYKPETGEEVTDYFKSIKQTEDMELMYHWVKKCYDIAKGKE